MDAFLCNKKRSEEADELDLAAKLCDIGKKSVVTR